jgi:ATP-dependent DNA ligase
LLHCTSRHFAAAQQFGRIWSEAGHQSQSRIYEYTPLVRRVCAASGKSLLEEFRRAGLLKAMPPGFIPPCLPTKAQQPPSGDAWLHEIKHDGFRVIARKDGPRVKLYSRPGNDLTYRFPLIVEALTRLRSFSCIIDGEAVCCDDKVRRSSISGVVAAPPNQRCLGLRIWCDLAVL